MKLAVRLPAGRWQPRNRTGSSHGSSPRLSLALQPGVDPAGPPPATKEVHHLDRGSLGPVAVDPGFEESVLELGGSAEQTDGGVGQFGRTSQPGTLHCLPVVATIGGVVPRSCRSAVMTSLLPGGAGDSTARRAIIVPCGQCSASPTGVEVDGRTVADIAQGLVLVVAVEHGAHWRGRCSRRLRQAGHAGTCSR